MKHIILILFIFFTSISYSQTENWKVLDSLDRIERRRISRGVKIKCLDTNNVIALLKPGGAFNVSVRMTTDAGISWKTTLLDTNYFDGKVIYNSPNPRGFNLKSLDLCIIICDSGYYWRGYDSLRKWQKLKLDKELNSPLDIDFLDKQNCIISSYNLIDKNYYLYSSIDSAKNWIKKKIIFKDTSYNSLKFHSLNIINKDLFYLNAYKNANTHYQFKSSDSGDSWEFVYKFDSLYVSEFNFLNEKIGFAPGHLDLTGSGWYKDYILKTSDGGKKWDTVFMNFNGINSYGSLTKIQFFDELNGFTYAPYGKIYFTKDGGKTWIYEENYLNSEGKPKAFDWFGDIDMINKSTFFAVANSTGKIWRRYPYPITDVEEIQKNINLLLYPNPINKGQELNISFDLITDSKIDLRIFNSLGEEVDRSFSNSFEFGEHKIQYKVPEYFPPGMYFLRVESNGTVLKGLPFIVVE